MSEEPTPELSPLAQSPCSPDFVSGGVVLYHGDCLEVLRGIADASVDAIVTDPPYGLSFMGKRWDYDVPSSDIWRECLRVLKPGGHLLAFAGTRTQHRMAVNIEDAGFEIRDMIAWVYGSGFPKSADVSKMLDKHEQKQWLDVCKAIDNTAQSAIMEAWKKHSKTASNAGLSFTKSETETGTNTRKSGSVPASVLLQANPENSDAVALVAELSLIEARLTSGVNFNSAQSLAESSITELRSLATSAANPPASHAVTLDMPDFSALQNAWGWQDESKADKLKAVEALKTWLGSNPSSRQVATSALCAALTADLKLITLSQSKTFQSFDTTRQTACASAISVTITESTAESLISFTADTLRNKAIDKSAGAEREVVGKAAGMGKQNPEWNGTATGRAENSFKPEYDITAPATEAARQWQGWGTALKPALEPITVARKPLEGTVAENVLKHGTGGINVDGCRVPLDDSDTELRTGISGRDGHALDTATTEGSWGFKAVDRPAGLGRWPANLIHDGSDEVNFTFSGGASESSTLPDLNRQVSSGRRPASPARFFYCAKASKADRDEGLDEFKAKATAFGNQAQAELKRGNLDHDDGKSGMNKVKMRQNTHPTVKPTELMRYLCRLVTPPGGIVLDPFMGSGSTGKAATLEGFQFIGIEREEEYIKIAEERIKRELAQGDLFLPNNVLNNTEEAAK